LRDPVPKRETGRHVRVGGLPALPPRPRFRARLEDRAIATLLTIAEFAILAPAAALAIRLLAKPPLRRDAAAHPALALAVGVALVAAAAVVAWSAATWPLVRHVAAGLAIATMFALAWRARPDYGAGRGWPPGSLGLAASLDAIDDRRYYRDQAARHGPVFKMSQFGRPVACIVGHERSRRILSDHADALVPATLPYNRLLTKGVLRYMTGADHRQEAPVFRAVFAKMDVAGAEATVRASLRRELAALAAASQRDPGGAYAREAFHRWLVGAIARLFLGIEPRDARVATISRLLPLLAFHRAGGRAWRRDMLAGVAGLAEVVREIAREAAAGSPSVARGTALSLLAASDDSALESPARIENFVMIFRIASNDLTGLLDWIFRFLGDAPQWRDAVRAHGRTPGGPATAPPFDPATCVVMETLRLEQSEFIYRRVAKPFEVDGRTIPAGWILRLCVNEAHRDPSVFEDPDRFDPARFRDRAWSRNEYSPFGGHTHGCMGAHLAHFLGRLFVEELAIGYDWTVVRDGPLERGSRHRDHWRPSTLKRVAMRPRDDAPRPSAPVEAIGAA
jgi:cytochrome P450